MYPQTLACLVKTADGGNVDEGLEQAKRAVFNDMWDTAWGGYGKYDPVNAPDPQHPYMGNEIWMTYEEALVVLSYYRPKVKHPYQYSFARANTRTLPPINLVSQSDMTYCFQGAATLISIHLTGENTKKEIRPSLAGWMFDGCKQLKNINGYISLSMCTNANLMFRDCGALESVNISELKISIGFPDSPLLSLASLQYLVTNAANTSAVAVTVHPDVYAKLTGDTTNEAAAALTEEEATAWQQVLAEAVEKNISFATI